MTAFITFVTWIGDTAQRLQIAATRSARSFLCLFLVPWLHLAGVSPASGANLVSIDLDPDTPGIQTQREVPSGSTLVASIVIEADAGGLSSYAVSTQFDSSEVDLSGTPAATEFLPTGFDTNLTAGGVEAETEDTGSGVGQVLTFEAVAYSSGPVSSTFIAGEIDFTVTNPDGSSELDVESGFFNLAIDGAFDNSGQPATIAFAGASVDPQVCGDGAVQGTEQCDDGNVNELDGCSALCRNENDYQFQGTAQGGSITFVVEGFEVVLVTTAGQTAAEVASAMAAAINSNADLSALGATASSVGNQVVVAGSIDSVAIGDSGLLADLPLSPIGIPFLLVGLVGSALLVLRRSPLARNSRR